jgi:hypothetical protein
MPVNPQPIVDDPGPGTTGTVWGLTWQRAFEADINSALASAATDATLSTTDITTNNVSTTKHGFAPKAPNAAAQFLNGVGGYSVPGGGTVVQTTTLTGTQNDFALTSGCTQLRCNNATALSITGLSAGFDGQRLTLVSVGAGQVDLSNQAGGSSAGNRIINTATATISLAAGSGSARLEYDNTTARWRVLQHDQGAWINVPYSAGNFTSPGGTWTVASGDMATNAYVLRGRTLTWTFRLSSTSTTTPGGELRIALPGGFLAAHSVISGGIYVIDNNTTGLEGYWNISATTDTFVRLGKTTISNWAASSDATDVGGTISFEVQ